MFFLPIARSQSFGICRNRLSGDQLSLLASRMWMASGRMCPSSILSNEVDVFSSLKVNDVDKISEVYMNDNEESLRMPSMQM